MKSAAVAFRRLARATARAGLAALPDTELLALYRSGGGDDAFAELVGRHGPMVLGLCRRVTGDAHVAEDAFQAAFLALARKAHTVRQPGALPAWLFATARRIALRARAGLARRRESGPVDTTAPAPDPLERMSARELLEVLDEELARLPAPYRSALLLCAVEGLTVEAAARQLGATPGAVRGWLQRGRDRLRSRLEQRGLAVPAALAASLLLPRAGVPAPLAGAAARLGVTPGAAAPGIVALAAGGLRTSAPVSAKLIGAALLAAGLAGVGAALLPAAGPPADVPSAKTAEGPPPRGDRPVAARVDQLGDPLPAGVLARLGTMRLRHGATVQAITFSADGRLLATGGFDGVVHVWETATGRERMRAKDDRCPIALVLNVALSPDGRHLAAAWLNSPPDLCDVSTGKRVRELGDDQFRSTWLRFSPGGKYLAFDELNQDRKPSRVHITEVASGKRVASEGEGEVFFLPGDRSYIYRSGADDGALLFRELAGNGAGRQFAGLSDPVSLASLSADGRTLASYGAKNSLRVWDVATGKERCRPEKPGPGLSRLAVAPDGQSVLAVGQDSTLLRCWDGLTGKLRWEARFAAEADKFATVEFVPGVGKVFSTHAKGKARLWDLATGKELVQKRLSNNMRVAAVSPDGKSIATASNSLEETAVALWDAANLESRDPVQGQRARMTSAVFSPDGRTVATAGWDGSLRLWEPRTGRPLVATPIPTSAGLAVSPDGRALITGGWGDGKVRFWDAPTGKHVRQLDAHPGGPCRIALSADGERLFTTGSDYRLRCWDVRTGKRLFDFDDPAPSWVLRMDLSPDGKTLATAHYDRTLRFWDTGTGKKRRGLTAAAEQIGAIRFCADGSLLAWSDGNNGIHLTSVETGQDVRRLPLRVDSLDATVFAPDGKTLAWGSTQNANTVRIWEVRTGQVRREFCGHDGPACPLAFSPDGSLLLTAGPDGSALIWDLHGRTAASRSKAATPAQLVDWWDQLALPDAARAYQAMEALRDAGPAAVELLRERLPPVPRPDAKQVAGWLRDWEDNSFKTREEASRALERLGEAAAPALRQAQRAARTPEARERASRLLKAIEEGRLHRERAVEVLEMIGDDGARKLLAELAAGEPDAPLTRDTAATLCRLKK